MELTPAQCGQFSEDGYLFIEECFSAVETRKLCDELPALFAEQSERRIMESNGNVVRTLYGSHTDSPVFNLLSRHPRLVAPASMLLKSDVYVHQFRLSAKAAFDGDIWDWHQDYIYWREHDGIPTARILDVAVYLDDVTEFNGPMMFIPGSHRTGVIEVSAKTEAPDGYKDKPEWISNLVAKPKFTIDDANVKQLVREHGLIAPKGPAGSVLFFDSNLVHASGCNLSPFDRTLAMVIYNSVENTPVDVDHPRPEFLGSYDFMPIVPASDRCLLEETLCAS